MAQLGAADPGRPPRGRSYWSSSAPTPASTGCAPFPTSARGTRYRDDRLVVIGAHSPEFPFEHEVEKVRPALEGMGVGFPVAMDNDFAVWRAFENNYWPALYVADAQGRLRDHHLGEELRGLRARHPAAARRSGIGQCRPRAGRLSPMAGGLRRISRRWIPRPMSATRGQRTSSPPMGASRRAARYDDPPPLDLTSGPFPETGRWADRPP